MVRTSKAPLSTRPTEKSPLRRPLAAGQPSGVGGATGTLVCAEINGSSAIVGSALAQYTGDIDGHFNEAMSLIGIMVGEGQVVGEVRKGSPAAIAHLYSVLINEHVLLSTGPQAHAGRLTLEQFHGLIDGALRRRQ